ncbi:HAD family hydrolase [Microbacterium deminutum]|uniref:HAD family hydrolase n=1 Tax=Microbacterium deminutum TaxID=344164 RepID=A0ABP5BW72_9MICO
MTPASHRRSAVLFDIDGTLVDSNYLHVDAWDRGFVAAGHPVDVWRIHRAIGMDSAVLLERLLGHDAEDIGDLAKSEHDRLYRGLADRLRPIPGARELLAELGRRGHTVVLATSAPQRELDTLLKVLDADQAIDVVTSGEDVSTAKPSPDIIEVALAKASARAESAWLVGDSVWDVEAAARAGVACIGVRSGGYGAQELLSAGAVVVYDDVADLLRKLDRSPLAGISAAHPVLTTGGAR